MSCRISPSRAKPRNILNLQSIFHFSISLDKDSISSSSSDEENDVNNEDSSIWQSVADPSDDLIEEYSDDQRENIISIIQTVPFGGDLFNTVWPQWLSGRYN